MNYTACLDKYAVRSIGVSRKKIQPKKRLDEETSHIIVAKKRISK